MEVTPSFTYPAPFGEKRLPMPVDKVITDLKTARGQGRGFGFDLTFGARERFSTL